MIRLDVVRSAEGAIDLSAREDRTVHVRSSRGMTRDLANACAGSLLDAQALYYWGIDAERRVWLVCLHPPE